jgi:hypothetical protein
LWGLTCPTNPTGVSLFSQPPYDRKALETTFMYRKLDAGGSGVITILKFYSILLIAGLLLGDSEKYI